MNSNNPESLSREEEARLRKLAALHGYTVQLIPYAGACATKDGMNFIILDRLEEVIAAESPPPPSE